MNPLLEVRHLSISFHTYRGLLEAVHDVSITVRPGETVGIVGESGCGKSVTSQAVMKLLPQGAAEYRNGEILWEGRDLLPLSESEMNGLRGRDMAMIFQDPMTSLNPVLTIGAQLCEGLALYQKLSKQEQRTKAVELLKAVGLTSPEKRLDQYPHQLSGGMRQRCLIAMALSCSPKLLFADEPTTALDVTTEAQVLDVLKKMQAELGMAVVLISHNLGVIAQMCRRIYVMYAGTVVEEGTAEDIFTDRLILIPRGCWPLFRIQRIGIRY
jgi:nickel_nikD: nickel import ATP-binding protein NikD